MIDQKFLDELAKELKKLKVSFHKIHHASPDKLIIKNASTPGRASGDISANKYDTYFVVRIISDPNWVNEIDTFIDPIELAEAIYKMTKKLPKEAKAASNDSIDRLETLVETRMQGNYNSDKWLFDKVDKFILDNYEDNKKDAKRAVKLLDVLSGKDHGEVSDEDLIEVVRELKA